MVPLLLASASPRRKELLEQIGLRFQVQAMDIDETVKTGESAFDYVLRLAREKAQAGVNARSEMIVLAADTTVVLNGEILGKPENEIDARAMLEKLSGSKHQVLTGIAMAKKVGEEVSLEARVVETNVYFSTLNDQQIEAYIKSGEPMGKAGAYGIQGKAALFVERIEGSYSNVVGLPIAEAGKMLAHFGVDVWERK